MRLFVLLAAALLWLAPFVPAAAQAQAQGGIPDWFRADLAAMTRDGGRWVADNSNPDEPWDRWVMEWTLAPDGTSMTGRLFGISDGRESEDFWQFRQFWHPAEEKAVVMQWGAGGMVGTGEMVSTGEGRGMLDQTFWTPDGRSFRVGHTWRNSGDERVTEQYDVPPGESAWRLNHVLAWRRERAGR